MAQAPAPDDEAARLRELDELGALEVIVEPVFQAIASLASQICRTPIALVNLLGRDRQYFKGHIGVSSVSMDRRVTFCPYTATTRQTLEVPDALADPRFRGDPIVTGDPYVRFYAGAPMVNSRDIVLGVVCVFDHRPRRLAAEHLRALETLALCAVGMLELRHHARQAERVMARLRELEELKHQFLRTVNHELRTPLTSIRSYLQLLQEGGLDPETEQRFMQVIERNGDRILDLVDGLLLMASLNARTAIFHPARTDLAELARQAVAEATAKAWGSDQSLTLDAPERLDVLADAGRIRHVMAQLLDNAIKFTPSGGRVTVTVTGDPVPAVEVRDTGIGIEPDQLEHVFDDFYRAPQAEYHAIGGTGIGLSIVQKVMRMHGGSVRIVSRPGEGSSVRFTLPAAPPTPSP
ncbi:histidine kinase [Planomonospora sphaerica]|uniref:histidine kinase n=1 Tax=Planomonospora sphaerica TaxID=161355 RepID=A0A171DP50_9ACTN|nr:GAF domain-containing sensor histidine kinase [Planomonospora sphaerica]GAT70834.1 histidine kinase [Planomonospora sphaerica]